jgi:hypothetical protein
MTPLAEPSCHPTPPDPIRRRIGVVVVLVALGVGCAEAPPSPDTERARFLERVVESIDRRRDALGPKHEGLVFALDPAVLMAALEPVGFVVADDSFVLATRAGPEPHGGGILALLLRHWKPDGRGAGVSDSFWFSPNRASLPLERLYRG